MIRFFLIVLLGSLSQQNSIPKKVSIVNLIATPEKYDKEYISVSGYFSSEFENDRIFLDKSSADHIINENGITIIFDSLVNSRKIKNFNNKYVVIEGFFNKAPEKNYSSFTHYISKIYKIDSLKTYLKKDSKW